VLTSAETSRGNLVASQWLTEARREQQQVNTAKTPIYVQIKQLIV